MFRVYIKVFTIYFIAYYCIQDRSQRKAFFMTEIIALTKQNRVAAAQNKITQRNATDQTFDLLYFYVRICLCS